MTDYCIWAYQENKKLFLFYYEDILKCLIKFYEVEESCLWVL